MATSHLWVLLFLSVCSLSLSEKCHPNEKKALLQIKKDLNNPSNLVSWNPKTDCCQWKLVKCDAKTNRITEFELSEGKLNLPIPAAVGDLPFLQRLTFQNTTATGPIPKAISKLSDLLTLDLRYNLLTGPIPAFLGHLKKLAYVGLSNNRLTGGIPETFADISLDLSHNQLSGPIPRKLGYANFSAMDVSWNNLEGDMSFLFGKNKSLVVGYFSRNKFEFDLTKVEFSESLTNLDLNHNKIYGSIPKDLSSTGIIMFNVSYNLLCGPIPELRRFQTFDSTAFMHNKCLCGKPLPACK